VRDHTLQADSERTHTAGRWRATAPLAGVTACLLLAAVIINPFREMLSVDDGWAYARSVEHLLRTGEYQLDDWSAANMPVQIYLAGGLSKVFGYSLSLLRLTTVAMLAMGLASFYGLARDLGAARSTSFAATLALLASPLVLLLSFTFMSDVQFMGWMLAALFLYVRGLRQGSEALVFLGSIAAAAAIGTRQFGVVIVGGLLIAWMLSRPEVRPRLRTMLLAAAVPAAAAAWQLRFGLQEPNFTQVVRLSQQGLYLGQPPAVLAHEFLWRAAIVLQYLGISVLPALPLLVGAALARARESRRTAMRLVVLAVLIGLALCAVLLSGSPLTGSLDWRGRLWPPLGLEWFLPFQLRDHPEFLRPIDLAGLGVAAVLAAVAVFSARGLWPIRRHRPETILLVAIPACLLGLQLFYVQLIDTYIVPFVPFALLLLAVRCRGSSLAPRLAAAAPVVSLAALVVLSLWIRADFAMQTAKWAAADRLIKSGVPAAEIDVGWTKWMEYHGAFDDWLAAEKPGYEFGLPRPHAGAERGVDPFLDPFFTWLVKIRGHCASYHVQTYPIPEPGWLMIARDGYRDFAFKRREIFTREADDATKAALKAQRPPR
jgi:4-amino-4-deoxy-L-arabinose transferase-like glycosyltransferase